MGIKKHCIPALGCVVSVVAAFQLLVLLLAKSPRLDCLRQLALEQTTGNNLPANSTRGSVDILDQKTENDNYIG